MDVMEMSEERGEPFCYESGEDGSLRIFVPDKDGTESDIEVVVPWSGVSRLVAAAVSALKKERSRR
jgi:hypothetical protein